MANVTPQSEQSNLGGQAHFLLTNGDTIDPVESFGDEVGSQTQKLSIIGLHWSSDSGGLTLGYNGATGATTSSIQLYGGGAWSKFNQFTPIPVTGVIEVTAGNGQVFVAVKKVEGFAHRTDYTAVE